MCSSDGLLADGTAERLTSGPQNAPRYGTGFLLNVIDSNECMGISLPIPAGCTWAMESGDTDTMKIGTHMPNSPISLLMVDRKTDPSSFNRVIVMLSMASGSTELSGFCGAHRSSSRRQGPSSLRTLAPCIFCGVRRQTVHRVDYKQKLQNGGTTYSAYLFTKFRGYLLGTFVVTASATALDDAADMLRHIWFGADQTNAECIVGDNTLTGRIVGVIGSIRDRHR